MSSADIQRILELSLAERLRLVEEISDSIVASPEELLVTDAQRLELDRRLAEYRSDPTAGRTWTEVCDSLR
jgi:putative addiction module component (TIGR02574 family)